MPAINPDYVLNHQLHELTQIKNNQIHWIKSGLKFVLGYIRDFVDMVWFHSRDSRFHALSGINFSCRLRDYIVKSKMEK